MPYRAFDQIALRCPQLGGEVTFGYCRVLNNGLPCHKALVCFELKFPVEAYFRAVLTEQTYDQVFNTPPPSRMEKLLTVFNEAQERVKKD